MSASSASWSPSIIDTLLAAELAKFGSQSVTIHAGHYALFRDRKGGLSDYLLGSGNDCSGFGFEEFSRFTWKAACRAVAAAERRARIRLMVLVNDWQFISLDLAERRDNEQAMSKMRDQYYSALPTYPTYHLGEMERNDLSTDTILRFRNDQWLYSESALRSELPTLLREVDQRRAEAVGLRKHFNENGEPIIDIGNNESSKFRLLHCGNTNCAGEIVSLLRNLYDRGVRRFLNIHPSICREPVDAGTCIAYGLFRLDGFEIVNIAVSGASGNGTDLHAAVERFNSEEFSDLTQNLKTKPI